VKKQILKLVAMLSLSVAFMQVPAQAADNSGSVQTDLVTLRKSAPAQVVLGQEYPLTYTVTARTNVGEVLLSDRVPKGASFVKSEPATTASGDLLQWKLGSLADGQSAQVTAWFRPTQEGELASCATVSAIPLVCVSTFVGKPVLAITKTGPAQALIGSQVPYSITVTNTGTAPASNVVVTDNIPAGLSHASGDKAVAVNVGTLNPGESRTLPISLKADARGRHCNVAVANSSNAAEVRAEACTLVVQQGLAVAKTGTKEQFANKVADYEITVSNTGDTSLTNVVVTDTPPTGTKVLKTQPAGNETRGTVVWTIAELKAGEKQTFAVSLTSPVAGNLCNQVGASSAEGVSAQAEACTLWKGHPALLIEVVDTVDPLLPGESTTYIIQVKNQGTAPDHNVGITVRFPASISPTAVSGVTAGKIDGKVVTFPPVAQLEPKQVVEWRVEAKADVTAGDSRLKVEMRSDLLKSPVVEEESTHVY
jgi:uncharacterized repeat protein (TIGR01451 family)